MKYWIKERHNPQLGVYFVACGQMPVKAAKRHELQLYGSNIIHRFDTQAEYEARLQELVERGERVTGVGGRP